jgi:hypothetical protein
MAITLDGTAGITTPDLTDTSLTSGRVVYAGASGNLTGSANLLYSGTDMTVYGLTVGRGAGAVSTNTAVGASALASTSSGFQNTAIGSNAAQFQTNNNNTAIGYNAMLGVSGSSTGGANVAIGANSLSALLTGDFNVAVGRQALQANTTASNNTAVGYQAGYTNSTGAQNAFFGRLSGYYATGGFNTFLGDNAGSNISSGTKNTVIGRYDGNQNSLDIRTLSNYIVLSDGDGVPRGYFDNNGTYNIANTTGSNIPAIKITQNDSTANRFLRGIQVDQTTTGAGENVSTGALRLTYTGGIGFNNTVENIVINSTNVPGTSQDGYGRKSVTTLPASSSSSDFNNNYFQNYSSLNLNGYLSNTGGSGFRTGFYAHYVGTTTPASTNQNVYGVFISNGGTISDGYVFGVYQAGSSRNYFEGKMYMPAVYSNTVGGTNRDVFVDNNGLVGYVSSTRASKKNITSITDVSWLLKLNPVAFNRRVKEDSVYTEETYSELEYGLIAEEAETVNAELCFYDDVKVQQPEGYEGEDQFNKELRGVHYNKLIVPLLKMVQELKAELDAYKASQEATT